MVDRYTTVNGVERKMNDAENAIAEKDEKDWIDNGATRKLSEIKSLRLERLIDTDYLSNSDVTMPDNIKTWRQSLRDLPANHTDEDAYDLLLARDSDGNLTHAIWSKPQETK